MDTRYFQLISLAIVFYPFLILQPVAAQDVEFPEYREYFYHYADSRSWVERVINRVDLTLEDLGRSVALIASVSDYPEFRAGRRLEPATVDVQKMKVYLKDYEFFDEIIVLENENVTYENLQYFLQDYIPSRMSSPRSRFLFIYSGHGMEDGGEGYILTNQARHLQDKARSINLRSLKVLIDETVRDAHHSLVLLNACYSGVFLRTSYGNQQFLSRHPGAHAITAGAAGELTWASGERGRGSDFFEKLLAGLYGRADTQPVRGDGRPSGDGLITVSELFAYIEPEIRLHSNQTQNPQMGDIYPNQSLGSFFFFNRLRLEPNEIVPEWESRISQGIGIPRGEDSINPPPTETNVVSSMEATLRDSIKAGLISYDGQRVFFRSERFPDFGILVEGKMGEHSPPYTIQVLARHWDRGYVWAHQDELKQYFHPLIDLGATYEITNIIRRDYLGIRLKTSYLNVRQREDTLSKVAEVIYSIFYELIESPTTESLIASEYEPATHPSIPSDFDFQQTSTPINSNIICSGQHESGHYCER